MRAFQPLGPDERRVQVGDGVSETVKTCPNPLHAYPLANGEGYEEAHRRLRRGWKNNRCPDCKLYGWVLPIGGK